MITLLSLLLTKKAVFCYNVREIIGKVPEKGGDELAKKAKPKTKTAKPQPKEAEPVPEINEAAEEKPISFRRMWIRDHKTAIYIVAGVLLIAAVFFGIRFYNNMAHPITRFMKASAKNFNSSFSFELEATKNGETMMRYSGEYAADASKQNLKASYSADYGDYTYSGVVFAEGGKGYSGSLYDGKWRARDCTDKVLNFFDFNTDYKKGSFDGASFLRFTGLTYNFSPKELGSFMKLFKSRMDGNSPLAKVEITSEDGDKTYTYHIDMGEFFDMVRDKGASVFYSSIEYDEFCALYELNKNTAGKSEAVFRFTVNSSGWLSDLYLSLNVGEEEYAVHCTMDDFGSADPEIPQEFFDAAIKE